MECTTHAIRGRNTFGGQPSGRIMSGLTRDVHLVTEITNCTLNDLDCQRRAGIGAATLRDHELHLLGGTLNNAQMPRHDHGEGIRGGWSSRRCDG